MTGHMRDHLSQRTSDDPHWEENVHALTELDKQHYTTSGYTKVTCTFCGTCASARKNSQKHTSIQWDSEQASKCALKEDRASVKLRRDEADESCPRMAQSVNYAYSEGLLRLTESVDPEPGTALYEVATTPVAENAADRYGKLVGEH